MLRYLGTNSNASFSLSKRRDKASDYGTQYQVKRPKSMDLETTMGLDFDDKTSKLMMTLVELLRLGLVTSKEEQLLWSRLEDCKLESCLLQTHIYRSIFVLLVVLPALLESTITNNNHFARKTS
jgi:hypothetical protein